MKTALRITIAFLILGVLPIAFPFPPSVLIIYPLLAILGIYLGSKASDQCFSKKSNIIHFEIDIQKQEEKTTHQTKP